MAMDLFGINNQNEYYTNHYFASYFEENASEAIAVWRAAAKEQEEIKTPWSMLRAAAKQYYPIHDRYERSRFDTQTLGNIRILADSYLKALGYPEAKPQMIDLEDGLQVPVYLELQKANGAPNLWVLLAASDDKDADILQRFCFAPESYGEEGQNAVPESALTPIPNEKLADKILYYTAEPPRFLIFIGMNQIALIDRNKWNEKRYLDFNLGDIFSRNEETTLQAMAVLLHKDSLCPEDGTALIDEMDADSQKHAQGVSQDLKFALRECIELLGNEVLYDMVNRQHRNMQTDPVDAGELTLECLRYMYRMLFVLFIESRPELGYAPMKAQVYQSGYSLESLREIAENVREEVENVGEGFYLHETLSKLYDLIYQGYPLTEKEFRSAGGAESLHDLFLIAPLKAHIFDPEYTKMLGNAKLRNKVMLQIVDKMSMTQESGKKNARRGRISYANLGINQMGSVYEALLSYRGFIAEEDLYEVKRKGDKINDLDVGYFVKERELSQYDDDERVRVDEKDPCSALRIYPKGTFVYRLAGREREKSASYYTPECLTKCLVKYALKELLKDKTADEILNLTVCEPAMGSAAFLNEAINQLAEAYLSRKQKELGESIPHDQRVQELLKVKMYIADRNVYGIDLNPVAVELAEVSLWLNTIYGGAFVPWFGNQLVNGNSLIGARRQCYRTENLAASSKGLRWFENAPERIPMTTARMPKNKVFHFLLGDPGMCDYTDKVIKSLEPDNIKAMKKWNKDFNKPCSDDEIQTMLELSKVIHTLWKQQIVDRKALECYTHDSLSVYGHPETSTEHPTSIREKDKYLNSIYRSEKAQNAGAYARLKFAMDYWCALWFWPIDQVELLPSRSEYLNDMNMILIGVMQTSAAHSQMNLFGAEEEEDEVLEEVNLDQLCQLFPRLALVQKITEQNKFMHWELEFADLFADRGGFDLVVGNPPWIKIEWNEQGVLADEFPLFGIRDMSATKTASLRNGVIEQHYNLRTRYLEEYTNMTGQQNFLSSTQNYKMLIGTKNNLYKCFLPQAWMWGALDGVSAFVHPNSIFDDSNGGMFRKELYSHIKKHFRFENEFKLFQDVGNAMKFSLNVYSNISGDSFEAIFNLFDPQTIDFCYESNNIGLPEGIKDKTGNWSISGHKDRIIRIDKSALKLFATLIDGNSNWAEARMPTIHAKQILEVLQRFASQEDTIDSIENHMFVADLWNETTAQQDGYIERNVHFPSNSIDMIFSGPHIGVANPLFQTSQRDCKTHRAFDNVDLTIVPVDYIQRMNYSIACPIEQYLGRLSTTSWGNKYNQNYRVISRKMLNLSGERSLISCIAPPNSMHTNGILGLACQNLTYTTLIAGLFASVPYDFFVKTMGRQNLYEDNAGKMPVLTSYLAKEIMIRALSLNCISNQYHDIWKHLWDSDYVNYSWSTIDKRVPQNYFSTLTKEWKPSCAIKTDFGRRWVLVELDVLVAIALNMTLDQLKMIYRIQFPVMQQYEQETWYDANGRIVFTTNKSMSSVGYDRKEWESDIKNADPGVIFERTITDDTMPGGPVERTIQYVAPFDRCDREQDYETAWKFFEEKYKDQKT